jgi:hypothetical protein
MRSAATSRVSGAFFHQCLERGVFFAPSAFEAGFLSTAHEDIDIDETLDRAGTPPSGRWNRIVLGVLSWRSGVRTLAAIRTVLAPTLPRTEPAVRVGIDHGRHREIGIGATSRFRTRRRGPPIGCCIDCPGPTGQS